MTAYRKTFMLMVPWMVPGGADRCGIDMLRAYREAGWRTVVVSTRTNGQGNIWRHVFGRWADQIVDISSETTRGGAVDAMAAIINQVRPRVLCINNSHEAHANIRMIRRIAPDCLISALVHMEIPGPWDFPGKTAANVQFYDCILTVSDNLRDSIRSRISSPSQQKKVQSLKWFPFWPEPERPSRREAIREQLGIGHEKRVVLCPMRVTDQKQPDVVVKVAKKMPYAEFIVAGHGDRAALIENAGIANLRLLGYVEPDDMRHLMDASDVVFVPSRDEGIPLAFMEAMARRIPVCSTKVGGVAELVRHGETGWCVPRDLPVEKWVETLSEALWRCPSKLLDVAQVLVSTGEFSQVHWKNRMFELLDDSAVQAAPLVRITPFSNMPKVFVIGAPETGHTAVAEAFSQMGCRQFGWTDTLQLYAAHGHFDPMWDVVSQYDVFTDGMFNTGYFYEELYNRYPKAVFILSTRDESSWIISHQKRFGEVFKDYDAEEWLKWYNRRNADIRRFFAHKGGKLVSVDIFKQDHESLWTQLANSVPGLKRPASGVPFPKG